VIAALTLLSALFEAVIPWQQTPWGGLEAQGRIVAHRTSRNDVDLVYPTVVFTTAADEYRFEETRQFRAADYPVGGAVTVLYPAADPGAARIGSYSELSFYAAAAVVVAAIAAAGLFRALRPRRATASAPPPGG
jgi:hypothetical protein